LEVPVTLCEKLLKQFKHVRGTAITHMNVGVNERGPYGTDRQFQSHRIGSCNISMLRHVLDTSMKRSKCLFLTLAAGLIAGGLMTFNLTFNSHAVEQSAGPGRFHGQLLERAKEKLGLTDDQVAKIKTELSADKDSLKDLISRLHQAKTGLREAIQSSDATEASVRAAAAKVSAVEADLAVERMKLHSRISPILTDEQKEKVKAFQSRIDEFVDNLVNHMGDRLGTE
jgi:Spy/CpxP family protein refolding chaperone